MARRSDRPGPHAPTPATAGTIIASVVGNGLEWFDFIGYTLLAGSVARAFFPASGPNTALILTFAAFAVGFAARPVGGVLLGLYADRRGRRRALALMMGMMALGSLLVALTPGYDRLGLAAPILVVVARILQGLSVGAEFAGSATYLVEFAPPGRRMLYGSLQMCAQGVGILAASLVILALETALPADTMAAWGWRLPFAAGAVIGPVGLYMRRHLADSPEFAAARRDGRAERFGLKRLATALRAEFPALLCGLGLVAVGASISYLWQGYLAVYVVRELHLPHRDALVVAASAGILAICLYPVAGWLGDRIGAFRLSISAIAAFAVVTWPLYAWLTTAPTFGRLMMAELTATFFLVFIAGCHPGQLAMLFPVSLRTTGVALAYNTAVLLFGGLAPMTVSWLLATTGAPMVPAFYQIAVALLSLGLLALSGGAIRAANARTAAGSVAAHRPVGR
ncbi:MFS transporter [Segnochrobactrum spirostomi]|nr:MFS transporter [Segnochrobactrum spirostomi]